MDLLLPQLRGLAGLALLTLSLACSSAKAREGTPAVFDPERPWRKPGDRIDSLLPMEELLRRFRGNSAAPAGLAGGAPSPNQLARRFLTALVDRDTTALGAMLVSRDEFAWLVFPEHAYARPPYELDPDIFWLQLRAQSAKGLRRALDQLGGARLRLLGMQCKPDVLQRPDATARFWSSCDLRYRVGDSVGTRKLFGSMVELDSRVKFLSYANGL